MFIVVGILVIGLIFNLNGSVLPRQCARSYSTHTHISVKSDYEELGLPNAPGSESWPTEVCQAGTFSCYTLWRELPNKGGNATEPQILAQGCWESSGHMECEGPKCQAAGKQSRALNHAKFCCCSEDLCNANTTATELPVDTATSLPTVDNVVSGEKQPRVLVLVVLVVAVVCGMLAILGLLGLSVVYRPDKPSGHPADTVRLINTDIGQPLRHLRLSRIIGQGRYGTVWLSAFYDQEVAVKLFPSHHRQFFYNERDIYSLPFMDNPALLRYFGSDERISADGNTEYLLVLSYCGNGCLQDYLRTNTLDLATFCRMALSIARGLAHLHTEISKGDKVKPCIAHRDVNTRNILVTSDLGCCLSDLGLSIKIVGSHYYTLGGEQHASTKSINEVGTLRYMAPEVLEGAVNLRDCEASLKQIDVYALGLVLWELATRCSALYPSATDVPSYRLPFQAEIGLQPSFEAMQVLVSRNKARPLLPEHFEGPRLIWETIEDCWDQDAEARLTVLCVQERLTELTNASNRGTVYSYVSPTVNQSQLVLGLLPSVNNNLELPEHAGDKEILESTVSECTAETLLTLSPSEPTYQSASIHGRSKEWNIGPLQPYQGRNPCLERNLMTAPAEEPCVVARSNKHAVSHADPLIGTFAVRANTPIPYLQNPVMDRPTATTVIPKTPNVPGNGHHIKPSAASSFLQKPLLHLGLRPKVRSECGSLMKVIVSPFEERADGTLERKTVAERPTSLHLCEMTQHVDGATRLLNRIEGDTDGTSVDDEHPSLRMRESNNMRAIRELSARIKTPGDLPPSVRRKCGNRARLSLYDEDCTAPSDSLFASSSSLPSAINTNADSSF